MASAAPGSSIQENVHETKKKRDYVVGFALLTIHVLALGVFLPMFFSWSAVAVAFVLYAVTGFGVTLAFHRLLTHRSLVVPKPVEYALAIVGTLALQGGPIEWVSQHRAHHAHTDKEGDPHNAHEGMSWAHFEWLYRTNDARLVAEQQARWAPDLVKDPVYRAIEKNAFLFQVALGLALFFIGGWSWVIWGIFFRLVVVYHVTWLVNSASHNSGYKTYETGDLSTNNWFVALFAFGEGWHNNHHAFPFSAKHGLGKREIDPTFALIKLMKALGIAKNVKLPTPEMLDRLRVKTTSTPTVTTATAARIVTR